jgi:hypothetical protein
MAIASGLYWKLICVYDCTSSGSFYDTITIITEDNQQFSIPLIAESSKNDLVYAKNINLGLI